MVEDGDPQPVVVLDYRADRLGVEVADDGRGAPAGEAHRGYGIGGMIERAAAIGGELTAGAVPGGFAVTATLPVPDRSRA